MMSRSGEGQVGPGSTESDDRTQYLKTSRSKMMLSWKIAQRGILRGLTFGMGLYCVAIGSMLIPDVKDVRTCLIAVGVFIAGLFFAVGAMFPSEKEG